MIHALHRVTDFQVVGPHRLRIAFRDGLVREIDFRPVLAGSLLGPLRDQDLFNQVRLDPEVHTLVWPNGADFDPATLHDCLTCSPQWKSVRGHGSPRASRTTQCSGLAMKPSGVDDRLVASH